MLLLRFRGPSSPWLHGGHIMQEFGDVLQCHAAGHHLERRCNGDVDELSLLDRGRGRLAAGVRHGLLRIQTDLRCPAEVVQSREQVGTGGGARPASLWIGNSRRGEARWPAEHGRGQCLVHFGRVLLILPRNGRQQCDPGRYKPRLDHPCPLPPGGAGPSVLRRCCH